MLNICINKQQFEFEYEGIKVFYTLNTSTFVKDIFIGIQDDHIKTSFNTYSKFIYINPLTKLESLLSFSKTNNLYKKIITYLLDNNLINSEKLKDIINEINESIGTNYIQENNDLSKLISALFALNSEEYINEECFYKYLEFNKSDTKQLVIIHDVWSIKISKLKEFLNYYDFIVVSNSFSFIENISNLETLVIWNNTNNYLEVLDTDKLLSYLEEKINVPITKETFNNFINNKQNMKLNAEISYFLLNFL